MADRLSQRTTEPTKRSEEETTPNDDDDEKEEEEDDDDDGTDDEDEDESDDVLSTEIVRLSSKDRPDVNNFRQLLWKAMARFSRVAEAKSKELVPLFFTFLK